MKAGDTVYFRDGVLKVHKVKVISVKGGFATIKFEEGGGTRVRINKLYNTREKAEKTKGSSTKPKKGFRPPWDYLW